MPFQKVWDPATKTKVSDRTLTGPPRPSPETGTTTQDDGTVIVADQDIHPSIPPATPVQVNFPGPNEPIVLFDGRVSPRWWRFFDELYRRTGGVIDNINKPHSLVRSMGAPDSLVLSGAAPSAEITHIRDVGTVSLSFTGYAPT